MDKFVYAPAPESRDIARLKPSYQIFVDGAFRDGAGDAVKTINPADESPLAEVAEAGPSDVQDAVAAARRAFGSWSALPGRERGKYLFRIARAIQERARELAVLESLDNGKPIRESRDVDVPTAAAHFFYYAGWADKLGYAGFGPAPRPVGVVPRASTTSSPPVTRPKPVWAPSSQGVAAAVMMKNWLPLVLGPALAIASTPFTSFSSLISSLKV